MGGGVLCGNVGRFRFRFCGIAVMCLGVLRYIHIWVACIWVVVYYK